jgi:hypothetical protein
MKKAAPPESKTADIATLPRLTVTIEVEHGAHARITAMSAADELRLLADLESRNTLGADVHALAIYAKVVERKRDTGTRMDALIRGADWARTGTNSDPLADSTSGEATEKPLFPAAS